MKYKIPKEISFEEKEDMEKQIYLISNQLKNKIAKEHNSVIGYIRNKEQIVFDGNLHKYSYFLYKLEENSLSKAKSYLKELRSRYYKINEISMGALSVVGDFGTDPSDTTDVENLENVQNFIIKELLNRKKLVWLIETMCKTSNNLYHQIYTILKDAILASGYSFSDKTIRNVSSKIESSFNKFLEKNDEEAEKIKPKSTSDNIPEKVYTPLAIKKTPKTYE